jgi:hypothetical protein
VRFLVSPRRTAYATDAARRVPHSTGVSDAGRSRPQVARVPPPARNTPAETAQICAALHFARASRAGQYKRVRTFASSARATDVPGLWRQCDDKPRRQTGNYIYKTEVRAEVDASARSRERPVEVRCPPRSPRRARPGGRSIVSYRARNHTLSPPEYSPFSAAAEAVPCRGASHRLAGNLSPFRGRAPT